MKSKMSNKDGIKMRKYRKDRGLTIKEVAKKAGIHPNSLNNYEKGKTGIKPVVHGWIYTAMNVLHFRNEELKNDVISSKIAIIPNGKTCNGCKSVVEKSDEICMNCGDVFCTNCKEVVATCENGLCDACWLELKEETEYKSQLNPIYHV